MVSSEACRSSTAYTYESSRLYSLRTNKVQLNAALRRAVDRVGSSDYSRRLPRGHRARVRARQRSYPFKNRRTHRLEQPARVDTS
jgi:hypothetical protein